jgi:transposase-like protein
MTKLNVPFLDEIRNLLVQTDPEFLRTVIAEMLHQLMEADVTARTGVCKYQRSGSRTNYRNGYRSRRFDTRVGTIDLQIPKLRTESYFPPFLAARKRSEAALISVVQQAYVNGVSTRKMEALAQELGVANLDKSTVSRMCKSLDEHVLAFRTRRFDAAVPYVFLDATYVKVRQNHRIVSHAVFVAVGIDGDGTRRILDVTVTAGESQHSWELFLRDLVERGLHGVQMVTSDAHRGLQAAIQAVFVGSSWQRCAVHVMRNVLNHVAHRDKRTVSAACKTVLAQTTYPEAQHQFREVVSEIERRWGKKPAAVLRDAEESLFAYMAFPVEHHLRIRTTNIVERVNREIKRRCRVVSVFPDAESVLRLVGCAIADLDDEWSVKRGYFTKKSMDDVRAVSNQSN